MRIEAMKVMRSTGISPKERQVKSKTPRTTIATTRMIGFISCAIASAC